MARKMLLLAVLFVSVVGLVFAQTDFTVDTFIATSTTASQSTVRTKRAPHAGYGSGTIAVDTFGVASGSNASQTQQARGIPVPFTSVFRIGEATIASSAGVPGFLQWYWAPGATPTLTMQYTDATGTKRIATLTFSPAP